MEEDTACKSNCVSKDERLLPDSLPEKCLAGVEGAALSPRPLGEGPGWESSASARGEAGNGERGTRGDVGCEARLPCCCFSGDAAKGSAAGAFGKVSADHCSSCVMRSKPPAS